MSLLFFEGLKNASLNRSSLGEPAYLFAQNKAVALDQCSNLHVHHPLPNSLLQLISPSPLQDADQVALGRAVAQVMWTADPVAVLRTSLSLLTSHCSCATIN